MDLHTRRRLSDSGTSLYTELDLPKNASPEEIKRSYRKLALKYHPDKNQGCAAATEKFKEINRAHKVLSDPNKKKIYDQHGSIGLHIAEVLGEEHINFYMMLSSWWCQSLVFISCLLTGCCCLCCCCFCCNCCCGKCAPEIPDDIPTAEDLEQEIVEDEENKAGGNGPIVLEPVPPDSPLNASNGNNIIISLQSSSGDSVATDENFKLMQSQSPGKNYKSIS